MATVADVRLDVVALVEPVIATALQQRRRRQKSSRAFLYRFKFLEPLCIVPNLQDLLCIVPNLQDLLCIVPKFQNESGA